MTPPEFITLNDETLTVPQWAQRLNISVPALRYRLKAGWPLQDALTPAKRGRGSSAFADGAEMQRRRSERQQRAQAAFLQREFTKLVDEIDRALRAFQHRLSVLDAEHDRGVGQNAYENANDRATPVAQDGV
jgi:hypothetical protein